MFSKETLFLIVDDMPSLRKIIIKFLSEKGFTQFLEAGNGREAWDKLVHTQSPVGVIISDWNMPDSTGLDLLKRVRSDSVHKNVPFLLVTTENEKDRILEAMQAGVNNYIVKPFTPDVLFKKLESVSQKFK